MREPRINIFLPTYEPKPEHITQAVESVLTQTEQNWSLLIHDDASTADVKSMVEKYLDDPRITFKRNGHRLGIGGNWNACLYHLSAPIVQYLFQDDWYEPQYLEKGLTTLTHNLSSGFVSIGHSYVFDDATSREIYDEVENARKGVRAGLYKGEDFLRYWITRELRPNIIGEPSFVMMRREMIEKIGSFDEAMPQFLDSEYWIRCLLYTDIVFLRENLGSFRVHMSAASAQNQLAGAGIYDRLLCFERLIRKLPRGELRSLTIKTRNRALVTMARKFFKRTHEKGKPSTGMPFKMKLFLLRHPLLVLMTLWRARG